MSFSKPIALRSRLAIALVLPLRPPLILRGGGGCFYFVSLHIHIIFTLTIELLSVAHGSRKQVLVAVTFGLFNL